MNNPRYPIFCGNVLKVIRETEIPGRGFETELIYMPGNDGITNEDLIASIVAPILREFQEGYVPVEKRARRVIIPLKLERAVEGCEIKTGFGEIMTLDGSTKRCYELEIIRSEEEQDLFSDDRFAGYKFQRIID